MTHRQRAFWESLEHPDIDKEHHDNLSECFFLLKWNRGTDEIVGKQISVPEITASLSTEPHQSLSDFGDDCRVVEQRVISQAKGLLEVHQPLWPTLGTEDLDIPTDALSGDVGYRSVSFETCLTKGYSANCIRWAHRSACGYSLGNHSDHVRSWQNCGRRKPSTAPLGFTVVVGSKLPQPSRMSLVHTFTAHRECF